MRKFFLFSLLCAATMMMATTKVETFTPEDGTYTATYVTSVTSKKCDQATWTFFSGGILTGVGNFSTSAAVIRAKKSAETVYPYIESSSIGGGIDSLWFTWNSNGNESAGTWNVAIYINGDSVGAINMAGTTKDNPPTKTYGVGNLQIEGDFTIKFVNLSPYTGTGNFMRFVFDDLSWTTYGAAEKEDAGLAFAEKSIIKMIDAEPFTNELTKETDATPVLSSSAPEVATVDQNGQVTIVGLGTTVISAVVAENETYKADSIAYTLRVVPLNFKLETFDGAANATGNATYHTNDSLAPRSEAGIVWTTHLGSIRGALGGSSAANMAAVIRAKKNAEEDYGYLLSDAISGGIDSLAFDWNANGTEASRKNPWNIVVYINGDSVGAIHDAGAAVQPMGSWFRFSVGNLKIDGDFTIMIKNLNVPDDGTSNQYRFVVDNIEWYSYEAPEPQCEGQYGILVDGTDYIAGVKNEAQTEWLEYSIVADLNKDQTFVFEDHCTGGTFMAGQDNGEGNYKFNYTEGETAFLVPEDGHYTIYLKMYGLEDNWIWTVYADPTTGVENTVIKADVRKAVENGKIVIYRNGVRYTLQGQAF